MAAIADDAIESEYRKIIRSRAPRVIRTQHQHQLYLAVANEIVDKGDGASPAETEYLALLAVLIAAYERQHLKQKSTPADRLRELLRSHDLKPVALCDVFGSRGTVYEVLSGKRTISKRAAKLLAEMFSVSAEIFILGLELGMRHAAWMLSLLSAAAFAQNAPDNLAADALKKRLQSIDLLSLPNLYAGRQLLIAGLAKPQCASPLRRATPNANTEPMPIASPSVPSRRTQRDELLRVPAPACEK